MRIGPLAALRLVVVLLGLVAATLLVRALDQGLVGEPRPLDGTHAAFGLVLALTVMPGPVMGFFVGPRSGGRLRGFAAGGSGVTAFTAVLGGVFLARRILGEGDAGAAGWTAFAWCLLAIPLAAVDFVRLRRGDPPPP